jgi:hypothetical protein
VRSAPIAAPDVSAPLLVQSSALPAIQCSAASLCEDLLVEAVRVRPDAAVWVSGKRFNVDYLLDTSRGQILRRVVDNGRGGTTGGIGRYCGQSFVAVYVTPGRDGLMLQINGRRMPLNDETEARHVRSLGGLASRLTVSRPDQPSLSAWQLNLAGVLMRRIDPARDEVDELNDDFLADVANIVESEERRDWFLETKDPAAGPWDRW